MGSLEVPFTWSDIIIHLCLMCNKIKLCQKNPTNFLLSILSSIDCDGEFTLSETGTETEPGTWDRKMGYNNSQTLFRSRCNLNRGFATVSYNPFVPVIVPAGVNTP